MRLFLQALATDLHLTRVKLHQQNKTSQFLLKASVGKVVSLPFSLPLIFFGLLFDKTAHIVNPKAGAMMSAFQYVGTAFSALGPHRYCGVPSD